MSTNTAVRLVEAPVETLTEFGWALVLVAALVGTWWALGRNLLYLSEEWQAGWLYLIPLRYAARVVLALVIVAVDLWLLAGVVHVLG